MLRPLGMIAGWAAATVAVVALGWAAVGAVAGAVTDPPALPQPPAPGVAAGVGTPGDLHPAGGGTPPPATPGATEPGTMPATPGATEPAPTPAGEVDAATHTFDMAGGRVGVRAGTGAVALLFATPREGFTVDVRARGPARVDVRFTSGSHESRFRYEPGAGERLEERPG